MPPGGEGPGKVGVLSDIAHQQREPVVTGIGPQNEDERGTELERVIPDVGQASGPERGPADLGEHRGGAREVRDGVGQPGEDRHGQEHHPQDGGHEHQGGARIADLRWLEHGDRIGDRLHTGHGRTAIGKRLQKDEERRTQ